MNKTKQYAFTAGEGDRFGMAPLPHPEDMPEPIPTPIPTPSPWSSPVKIVETTYLISDSAYSGVKSNYTSQNMMGLVTATTVKDGAGTVVSRSETVYDESGKSPLSRQSDQSESLGQHKGRLHESGGLYFNHCEVQHIRQSV